MRDRTLSRIAWSLTGVSILLAIAGAILQANSAANPFIRAEVVTISVDLLLTSVGLAALGSLVAARQPHNALGWLFCSIALINGLSWTAGWYAGYAISTVPGGLPIPYFAAWLSTWVWFLLFSLPATFLFLLFPDGRLPSLRWRHLSRVLAVTIAIECLLLMFSPWDTFDIPLANPIGIESLGAVGESLFNLGLVVLLVGMVACLASLVFRFRAADHAQRAQLKTVGFGAVVVAVAMVSDFVLPAPWDAFIIVIGTAVFIASFMMAILRYRLYDIDRIISRTLAYSLAVLLLGLAYVGVVLTIQAVLPIDDNSPLVVAMSTLAVVALFRPVLARVREIVDRRFYRRSYDARLTLDAFSARLRSEVDIADLKEDLLSVVTETVHPVHVSVWFRPAEEQQ